MSDEEKKKEIIEEKKKWEEKVLDPAVKRFGMQVSRSVSFYWSDLSHKYCRNGAENDCHGRKRTVKKGSTLFRIRYG
jgi:hypothetical protein